MCPFSIHRAAAVALTLASASHAAPPVPSSNSTTIASAQSVHTLVAGHKIAIASLSDNDILLTPSGRQISVGQYKAGLARIKARQLLAPLVKVTPGMTLAAAAAQPAGTRVVAASGASVPAATLARIQTLRAQHLVARKIEPVLPVAKLGAPVGEVGKTVTLAQALSRNSADTLMVGSIKVSAAQLRYIDQHLKAAGRQGLADFAGRRAVAGASPGKVVKVARGTDPRTLLNLPPDTILESPGGQRISVATLKANIDKPDIKAKISTHFAKRKAPGGK